MSLVAEIQPINVLKIIEEGRVGGPQMDKDEEMDASYKARQAKVKD